MVAHQIQEKNSHELKVLIEDSAISESELNKIRQQQSKVDSEVRELERDRSMAELDLRTIAEKISNNRVELKTHQIKCMKAIIQKLQGDQFYCPKVFSF